MEASARALVRRWGGRAVGLTVTGVGLYIVAPSLLSVFGSWPRLRDVDPVWFFVLIGLETISLASLWWLTRLSLEPGPTSTTHPKPPPPRWSSVASAQLAGNAASKVVPGGAATGGVVQARLLVQDGHQPAVVYSALTSVALLTSGVLMLLPVLTIPALIIGPPPHQLQLGLLLSMVIAIVIVGFGVTALTWPRFVTLVGRGIGHAVHVVRRSTTAHSVATALMAQRDRVATAFKGRWLRAVFAAAANRMFDYAALVAALAAFDVHARPSEVLLAYVVAQALAIIPITPGGVGFVESGLTTLLVVIGVGAGAAAIGTLLYRLVSFWLPIPVGALAWAGWRIRLHRRHAEARTTALPHD